MAEGVAVERTAVAAAAAASEPGPGPEPAAAKPESLPVEDTLDKKGRKAVQAAIKTMVKAGVPKATCEARLDDLVSFGFGRVHAATALKAARGDVAAAMAQLLDDEGPVV
jgi:hypothetical protein